MLFICNQHTTQRSKSAKVFGVSDFGFGCNTVSHGSNQSHACPNVVCKNLCWIIWYGWSPPLNTAPPQRFLIGRQKSLSEDLQGVHFLHFLHLTYTYPSYERHDLFILTYLHPSTPKYNLWYATTYYDYGPAWCTLLLFTHNRHITS